MENDEFKREARRSALSNFGFNLLINGTLTWWLMSKHASLSAWGDGSHGVGGSYGVDMLATGFLLSAIVALIVMEISRRKVKRGDAEAVPLASPMMRMLAGRSRWEACLAFGALGTVLSGLLVLIVSNLTPSLSVLAYAGLKGVWAGLLAAAIVVPATLLGLDFGGRQSVDG